MKCVKCSGIYLAFGLVASLQSVEVHADKSYYIDQVINYSGSDCGGNDLFDDTHDLKTALDANGWGGDLWFDNDAWAFDFRENCSTSYGSYGSDYKFADNKFLDVFSGHGSTNIIHFAANSDTCNFNLESDSRLGEMAGKKAGIAMWLSCYTLTGPSPGTVPNMWLWQQFGFSGNTGDNTAAYSNMYLDTNTKTNSAAWMDRLWDQPATAVSYASGTTSCWTTTDYNAKMRAGTYLSPRTGGPACGANPVQKRCARWWEEM